MCNSHVWMWADDLQNNSQPIVASEACKSIKYNDLTEIMLSHFDAKPSSIMQQQLIQEN